MTQEFVTLPREVLERALAALDAEDPYRAAVALRAALEQPQNHVTDAGNMAPTGWKLVPVEPTDDMLYDIQEFSHILPPRGKRIWAHMLAAAPHPPTTEQSSAVEQPQAEQEPFAWISPRALEWGTRQSEKVVKLTCEAQPEYDFTEPLYTHPQPKREPLPDHYINDMFSAASLAEGDMFRRFARAIEAAHNIK